MKPGLRVAVVGAGPAGLYTVGHLLDQFGMDVEVDVFERLPTPWGLIRAGVAPDHPEKKLVVDRLFRYHLQRPQVRFFGNVEIGRHVGNDELAQWYTAVVHATGASADVRLGIPGEELPGCWSARQVVGWYNGHPDFRDLPVDLTCDRAVVVGNGNVALDIARILTLPVAELEKTDIAEHALHALRDSRVEEVVVLGRRSAAHAAFNNPELEELEHLDGVEIDVDFGEHVGAGTPRGHDWVVGRKLATLTRLAAREVSDARKRVILSFLRSPVDIGGDGRVEQLRVVRNRLEPDATIRIDERQDTEPLALQTGLVIRAIGYRGARAPGLPFDEHTGVIANLEGRVVDSDGTLPGVYVTGWIKRGARGIIGTNKKCAKDTVDVLIEDLRDGRLGPAQFGAQRVLDVVRQRQPELFTRAAWSRVERAEQRAGRQLGRPPQKIVDHLDFLHAAGITPRSAHPRPERQT